MARIRSINIGFFQNDALAELPALDRLLFAGLWVIADKAGRLKDRPARIKAEVMPYDTDFDCDAALGRLERARFVRRYQVEETRLIQIAAFLKHQKPHPREIESVLPAEPARTAQAVTKDIPKQDLGADLPDLGVVEQGGLGVSCLGDFGIGNSHGDLVHEACARDPEPHINTKAENDAKAAEMGVALAFSRPNRPARTGIDAGIVHHRACYGSGVLPSCARGICIPAFLGNQWLDQLKDDPVSVETVARFVASALHGIPAGPIGDEPLKFWRAQWQAAHGTMAPANGPISKGEKTMQAFRRVAAKMASDGTL